MIDRLSGQAKPAAVFNGARVTRTTDWTSQNFTGGGTIDWDAESFDTNGWHEGATHPSRLTVPSGVNYVDVTAMIDLSGLTAGNSAYLIVNVNGSAVIIYEGVSSQSDATARLQSSSGPVAVSAGDYMETTILVGGDTSVSLIHTYSFFSVNAIG